MSAPAHAGVDTPNARRILVIHTGGTIGMVAGPRGLAPLADFGPQVQAWCTERQQQPGGEALPAVQVRALSPALDSASLDPTHWHRLAGMLVDAWDEADGFVVLHGTDTLAWSASALAFLLQGADKPVVLTGSQIPWLSARSDAPAHLDAALRLAADSRLAGVSLCFGRHLWPGTRATKVSSQALDAFGAPNDRPLADLAADLQVHVARLRTPGPRRFSLPPLDPAAVTVITAHPGLQPQAVRALLGQPGLRGAVLCSYGLGNLPEDPALHAALADVTGRGVVLVNRSQCFHGSVEQGRYASSSVLGRLGVLPAGDMTLEAAFAKLHVLLALHPGLPVAALADLWRQDWAGEWGRLRDGC